MSHKNTNTKTTKSVEKAVNLLIGLQPSTKKGKGSTKRRYASKHIVTLWLNFNGGRKHTPENCPERQSQLERIERFISLAKEVARKSGKRFHARDFFIEQALLGIDKLESQASRL